MDPLLSIQHNKTDFLLLGVVQRALKVKNSVLLVEIGFVAAHTEQMTKSSNNVLKSRIQYSVHSINRFSDKKMH